MTHGFDDQGRQYDPKGNLSDWWTADSANKFKARAAGIVKEFTDYTVLDGVHLIGERTQGENIADLGGLKIAYAALQKDLGSQPRTKIDGFSPEQRFFISFASVWRGEIRPEELRLRIKTDPHSPAEFRCNGPLRTRMSSRRRSTCRKARPCAGPPPIASPSGNLYPPTAILMKLIYVSAALCLTSAAFASFDPKNLDPTVKPQDDFYLYADGGWIKSHEIPADRSRFGGFDELHDRNEAILHGILDCAAAAKDPNFVTKLVGDFYFSGMDLATVDSVGIAPLKAEFDRIDAIQTQADLAPEIGHLQAIGIGVCFVMASEQDPKNSEMIIAGQGQGGLGLPDRDYYLRTDDNSKKLRQQYLAHVEKMFELVGDSPEVSQAEAQTVMKLETLLATGSKTKVDLRDPIANYHLLALAEVSKLSPHFDWQAYLGGIGLPAPASMDIGQPEFLQALDAQLGATPVSDWKTYFRWQLVHACAPFLSAPFVEENFAFFGKTLTGAPKMRDRWKRVLQEVDLSAGEALGQLYVAEAFPPESKARMLALVGNIRTALHNRIEKLEWMDEPTRRGAWRSWTCSTSRSATPTSGSTTAPWSSTAARTF